jgi:hypothetical protein
MQTKGHKMNNLESLLKDHTRLKGDSMKSKTEKIVDMVYYACMMFFCGIVAGYAWCWLALN